MRPTQGWLHMRLGGDRGPPRRRACRTGGRGAGDVGATVLLHHPRGLLPAIDHPPPRHPGEAMSDDLRAALVRAYECQAWSSPDQMADMLLDGLRQTGTTIALAAESRPTPDT